MYFDRQFRAFQAWYRPVHHWFSSKTAEAIILVLLVLAFLVVWRWAG